MKAITKILFVTVMLCLSLGAKAVAITNPVITLNPTSIVLNQSNTWTFDFTSSSLTGSENLVIYFWQPTSHATVSLTNLGGKIWSFTFTPTTFFGLTQAEIAADPDQFWFNIQDGAGGVTGSLHTTFSTPVATTAPVSIFSNPAGTYPLDQPVTWTFDLTGSGFKAGQDVYMYAWSPTNPDPTYSNSTAISKLTYVSGMVWSKTLTPTTYFTQTVEQIQASAGFWMKLKDQAGKIETAAFSVSQTLKGTQTITFNALSTKTDVDSNFELNATSSSGLPVSYVSSNQAVATISGSTVTIINEGTTTITASQAGNSTYEAAPSVAQTLTITTPTDFTLRKTLLIDFGSTYASTSAPDANGNYWNNINTINANDNFALVDKTNASTGSNLFLISTFTQNGGSTAGGLISPESSQLNELSIASATGDYFFTGGSANFKLTGLNPSKRYKFYVFGSRATTETRQTKFSFTGKNTTAFESTLTTSGSGIGLVGGASYNGNTSNLVTTNKIKPSDAGEITINVLKVTGSNAHMNVMKVEEYQQATTWSGTGNWSDANWSSTPGSSAEVTVSSGELTINQSASIDKITLAPGARLTLGNGNTLSATNGIILESDANGTATVLGSGSLSGNVTAKQYLGSARNWYVSSPVSSASAPATNVDYYYEYVEAGNNTDFASQPGTSSLYWKGLSTGTTMAVGKGYIAKANAGTTVQFTGTPNNGDITTTFNLTRNDAKGKGFNLAGNPYPSYIDWSDVAAANPNLENTYYYRTKNTLDGYTFVTYNGAGSGSYVVGNGTANTTITRFIPPTQAFWVRVKSGTASTTMSFTNAMREHRDDNGNLMKAPRQNMRTSVRLQLQNGTESDELLIYQDAAASNGYDAYDSPKMLNNSATTPDLYTKAGDEKLVINGLQTITENMELPLGFSLNAPSTLKIKATELSNLPEGTAVYLLDKVANTQTELTPATEYSFTTTESTTNNESRFSVLFKAPGITTDNINPENMDVLIYVNADNKIVINTLENQYYYLYNSVGQKISAGKTSKNNTIINLSVKSATQSFTGVYIVKLIINNSEIIKRVIIK